MVCRGWGNAFFVLGENFFEKKLFPEPLSKNFIRNKITKVEKVFSVRVTTALRNFYELMFIL